MSFMHGSSSLSLATLALALLLPEHAHAQTLVFDGEVPTTDGVAYIAIPLHVPAGTMEIEIRHDDLSDANILDWGLLSPSGFRGYGGGNTESAIVKHQDGTRLQRSFARMEIVADQGDFPGASLCPDSRA